MFTPRQIQNIRGSTVIDERKIEILTELKILEAGIVAERGIMTKKLVVLGARRGALLNELYGGSDWRS